MRSKKLKKIIAIAIATSITATIMPVAASAQWLQNSVNNWSWVEDGNKTTGWKQVEGTWYYFDSNGDMKTGWVQSSDSKWYYLNSDGAMKTGWLQTSDGKWYNLASDGAMRTGWVQDSDGKWYKLASSGEMKTGWIEDSSGKWYFADSSGVMQTGVVQVEGKSYALAESGEMLIGTNVLTEGSTYTTDANGVIIQGSSSTSAKKFTSEGVPITSNEGSSTSNTSTAVTTNPSTSTETSTSHHSSSTSSSSSSAITKIHAINDINVANGTALSAVGLPNNVTVTLDNKKTLSVEITWNKGNPPYDGNTSGTYTFSGTLTLPEGIINPNNLKATVTVNVAAAEAVEKSVISVHSLKDITVDNGTSLDDIDLPNNVRLTLSDNTKISAAVSWDEGTPTYDGDTSGTYTFGGTLILPEDVINPSNLKATIKVNVVSSDISDKEVLSIRSISDINVANGTPFGDIDLPNHVRLILGDNTTTSAAVTWDDGNPIYDGDTPGTYTFSGELTLPEDITNPNNLKAVARVNVAAAEIKRSVLSVNPIPNINVANGTSLDDINLPNAVTLTLDDNTTTSAAVTWNAETPSYDGNTQGTYVFRGTLTLPENVTNPSNLKAIVDVIVENLEVSTAPVANNITVTNNAIGTNDTIIVAGLNEGDIVKIYDAPTGGTLLGSETVVTATNSATITITQLSTTAGNIYVSVTSTGKLESLRTGKVYAAEADTIAPILSGSNASGITSTGATLNFTSSESGTYYYLVRAAGDGTPDAATIEAQGTSAATAITNAVSITGLTASTAYNAYVIVKDGAGNASSVETIAFITTTAPDTTAPALGAPITFSGVTSNGMTLQWGQATDNATLSSNLRYKVVKATSPANIDTIDEANAVAGADVVIDWTANIASASVTGLTADTDYYFAAIVEDEAGNKSLYAPIGQMTQTASVIVTGDSVAGATAGDTKITGLTAGKAYKVTVSSTVMYTRADGTLTTNAAEKQVLTGTEITGLTNGTTYNVQIDNTVVYSLIDGSEGSLRRVIEDASAGDTITFAQNLTGNTITVTQGPIAHWSDRIGGTYETSAIYIDKDLNIIGPSLGNVVIDGQDSYQIFNIAQNVHVVISNLKLMNASDNSNDAASNNVSAAIYNQGNLTINNVTFASNVSNWGSGGAIQSDTDSTLSVNSSTFTGNRAYSMGGAIYAYECNTTINNCTFENNVARDSGGAIYADSGILTVSNSVFTGNHGDNSGSDIALGRNAVLTNTNNTFDNNGGNGDISGNTAEV